MKLWLFTFTDQSTEFAQIQVAAPDRQAAVDQVYLSLDIWVELDPVRRRGANTGRVIVSAGGEDIRITEPTIVSRTPRPKQESTAA